MEKQKNFLGENTKTLKMYEVPGQDKVSKHSIERYEKNQENFSKGKTEVPVSFPSFQKNYHTSSLENDEIYQKAKNMPIDDVPLFIKNGLSQKDNEIQKKYIESIGSARDELRAELLREAFEIKNEEVEMACVKAISNIPEKERVVLIRIGLSKDNFRVKKASIGMIQYAPPELRVKLIQQGLSDKDIDLVKAYTKVIHSVQEEKERKELLGLAKQKLGNALIESPLYDNAMVSPERFSREAFTKTGSGTTLIGGELKNKVIFRHIAPEAFFSWQEAYENQAIWKRAGFNYIPIEPIISFHQNKDGVVDVASGILDISFGDWEKMSGDFSEELSKEKTKIIEVLNGAGIIHGHPHVRNFCLRFFRKENGDVDFQKMPRIYLIDFDRAISSK